MFFLKKSFNFLVMEKKAKIMLTPKFAPNESFILKYSYDHYTLLKNIFGINKHFIFLLKKKTENSNYLQHPIFLEIYKNNTLSLLRFFLPKHKDLRYRYYAHLYFLFYIKSYRAYRHLLGLPTRGQRTWSNANTPFKYNSELKKIFSIKAWQKYPFLTRTYSNTAAMAELSNKLWKTHWLPEWLRAKKDISKIIINNVVKIDLFAMSKFLNRVEAGDYKISKKTKQKRKVEKKGSFTTGLEPGFAKILLKKSARELRHIGLQFYYTKTTRVIFHKDSKKKKHGARIKLTKGVKNVKTARKMQKKKKKTLWD